MKRTWVKCQNSTSLSFLYSFFLIFLLAREVYSNTFHRNQIENFDNRIPINRKPNQKSNNKRLENFTTFSHSWATKQNKLRTKSVKLSRIIKQKLLNSKHRLESHQMSENICYKDWKIYYIFTPEQQKRTKWEDKSMKL